MDKKTTPHLVQCRKTGVWYNPQEKLEQLFNSQFFIEIMVRLKKRFMK